MYSDDYPTDEGKRRRIDEKPNIFVICKITKRGKKINLEKNYKENKLTIQQSDHMKEIVIL